MAKMTSLCVISSCCPLGWQQWQCGRVMCWLRVIEVCIFPSCGRWSHHVPSVGDSSGMNEDRWSTLRKVTITDSPPHSKKQNKKKQPFCFPFHVCQRLQVQVSCSTKQQPLLLPSNYTTSWSLSAGWQKRCSCTKKSSANRSRRSRRWGSREPMNMTSRSRLVFSLYPLSAHRWGLLYLCSEESEFLSRWNV